MSLLRNTTSLDDLGVKIILEALDRREGVLASDQTAEDEKMTFLGEGPGVMGSNSTPVGEGSSVALPFCFKSGDPGGGAGADVAALGRFLTWPRASRFDEEMDSERSRLIVPLDFMGDECDWATLGGIGALGRGGRIWDMKCSTEEPITARKRVNLMVKEGDEVAPEGRVLVRMRLRKRREMIIKTERNDFLQLSSYI
jgi:hypothetical protein